MKKCHRCGTTWKGFRGEPRAREVCEICGANLHSCVNCHHFDHALTNSCKLTHTSFVGARDSINYCEEYRMFDTARRASEDRLTNARTRWENLFKK